MKSIAVRITSDKTVHSCLSLLFQLTPTLGRLTVSLEIALHSNILTILSTANYHLCTIICPLDPALATHPVSLEIAQHSQILTVLSIVLPTAICILTNVPRSCSSQTSSLPGDSTTFLHSNSPLAGQGV